MIDLYALAKSRRRPSCSATCSGRLGRRLARVVGRGATALAARSSGRRTATDGPGGDAAGRGRAPACTAASRTLSCGNGCGFGRGAACGR